MATPLDFPVVTQEADLDALLMARVKEMVQDMDLEIATKALKQTYNEGILKDGILNPQHLGGTYLRHLLQQALPKFLDSERKSVHETHLSEPRIGILVKFCV